MKGHWLKYLGLLGFLGFLAPVTSNLGMIGFFGFFGFFAWGRVVNDERLEENANKAARNAFVCSLVVYPVATAVSLLLPNRAMALAYAFAINFTLEVLVFTFSFTHYDRA